MLFRTLCSTLTLSTITVQAVTFQPLKDKPGLIDNGTSGPETQIVHLFHGEPPIGIAVSKSGRAFVTFNRGDLATNPITFGEITSSSVEVPFPSLEFNTPPGGLVNTSSGRTLGSSDSTHFINAQAAIIDSKERLWVLDSGRPAVNSDNVLGVVGGPKLVGFDLTTNATKPFSTITFPENVLPPTGYLNDVRIDLTPGLTKSGKGIAYIADSGAFGIIVVDLGTGSSWRHLDRMRSVSPDSRFLPTFFGVPTYMATPGNPAFHYQTAGAGGGIDGIAISADGKFIYYISIASRDFYRVETAALRANPADDPFATIRAANTAQYLGEAGGQGDGLETDSTGKIYIASPEHNSITTFDPNTGLVSLFVRSPLIAWPDSLSVADDGFIYATVNQLWLSPGFQNGTDKRVKPFVLVRAKIDGGRVKL